jgi:hypothetical protein
MRPAEFIVNAVVGEEGMNWVFKNAPRGL